MRFKLIPWLAVSTLIAGLAGCQTATGPASAAKSSTPPIESIGLNLACPTSRSTVPNADYIGPYMGVENIVPLKEVAQDVYCSDTFKARNFPRGFVTIYGSSRIKEKNASCDARGENCNEAVKAANDVIYRDTRNFAYAWTQRYGKKYPIMTGAGPGVMEAGNKGAAEAGGASVGYTTYYDRKADPDVAKPYGGDARLALNAYVTHGLIFSSVAVREYTMIKHSAAMVIAPGGTGTEWELFQIIETIKSRQLAKVPVYLLGHRQTHWRSLEARLKDMVDRKTVNAEELAFLKYAETSEDLIKQLGVDLGLN
ncbi:LOG family protein [Polaromonas sp.]|uniref:LOG family protein n=1 Tax=Polaromonas sp. TaxID=1869339 RepID=UPI003263FEE0